MTPQQAIQVLATALNQAVFTGTIMQITQLAGDANKALEVLKSQMEKPVE